MTDAIKEKKNNHEITDTAEKVGIAYGVAESGQLYADNVTFGGRQGHGYAAEHANHLWDRSHLQDASIVGADNAKNGADRLVAGKQIQTKYCETGKGCINSCFQNGSFRYFNADGSPMQIEVPSDMHEDAVKAMGKAIQEGRIKGVSDPAEAENIVRKGNFTYDQARMIAKAGTVESLTYDAVNGIKLAGSAAGITAAITFALAIWNGEDFEMALKTACYSGLKIGGVAWVSGILASQIGRTGIEQSLRGTTDWMVRQMGSKAASWITAGIRSGKPLYGAAAARHLSKVLRGNIVTGLITTVVLSSVDICRVFSGRVSGAQLFKNVTSTASAVAGGVGGLKAGAATGAVLGSFVPVVGTAVGAVVGGLFGSLFGGVVAQKVSSCVPDQFIEDDAKEMSGILEKVFVKLAQLYLLGEEEVDSVSRKLSESDLPDKLRDMYASSDRERFAEKLLTPIIQDVVNKRTKISLPSDEQMLRGIGMLVDELAESA